MTGYPWQPGDELRAADLNAAIANAGGTVPGGPFLPLTGVVLPTSPIGLPPGTLWNNGGVLCVA
jgi:hypothetical protein